MASSDTRSGFRLPWSSDRSHDESAPEGAERGRRSREAEPAPDDLAWPDTNIHARLGISTNGQRPPDEPPTSRDQMPLRPMPLRPRPNAQESQRMVEIEAPAAPAAAAQEAVEADGGPVGRDPRDRGGRPRPGAPAARCRRQAGHRGDPRGRDRGRRRPCASGPTTTSPGIRDWSKAEIARIREETDGRIATRKATARGRARGARRRRSTTASKRSQFEVDRFRADMEAYFERLASEEDPSQLATMVEAMPDLPSFEAWADSTRWPTCRRPRRRPRRRRGRRAPRPIEAAVEVEAVAEAPRCAAEVGAVEAEPVEAMAESDGRGRRRRAIEPTAAASRRGPTRPRAPTRPSRRSRPRPTSDTERPATASRAGARTTAPGAGR